MAISNYFVFGVVALVREGNGEKKGKKKGGGRRCYLILSGRVAAHITYIVDVRPQINGRVPGVVAAAAVGS